MNRNKEHRGTAFCGAPNGAAAPLGLCSLFLLIDFLYYEYLWIFLMYSLYIPYIFPKDVPYISPCVFLNKR